MACKNSTYCEKGESGYAAIGGIVVLAKDCPTSFYHSDGVCLPCVQQPNCLRCNTSTCFECSGVIYQGICYATCMFLHCSFAGLSFVQFCCSSDVRGFCIIAVAVVVVVQLGPAGTFFDTTSTTVRSCRRCTTIAAACDECDTENPQVCYKCFSGFVVFESQCVSASCPTGLLLIAAAQMMMMIVGCSIIMISIVLRLFFSD
jgi:hypothetical protein